MELLDWDCRCTEEWVTEDVVWAKLATLRAGADIASKRLWNRKVA